MEKIIFYKDTALPSNLNSSHDGLWFIKESGTFRLYVVSDGTVVNPKEVLRTSELINDGENGNPFITSDDLAAPQTLILNGTELSISSGNTVDLDDTFVTEQELTTTLLEIDTKYIKVTHPVNNITQIDIDNWNDMLNSKVDKIPGKGLSTEDFTTEEKDKLSLLENYDDSFILDLVDTKVDKEPGKELSSNDYTNVEKTKLGGIEEGAQKNVKSDWDSTSGDSEILNKPNLGSAAFEDKASFATYEQGVKADSAVQPEDLSDVAFTGDYDDLVNKPIIPEPNYPVTSVNGKTGDVIVNKADVGLSSVDDTSDLDKPISNAAQNALDTKVDKTTSINGAGGIIVGGSLSSGSVSLEVDESYLNSKYLRKDVNDSNEDSKLTLGELSTPKAEVEEFHLPSLLEGSDDDYLLVVDSTGLVKKRDTIDNVDISISNLAGTRQFGIGATDTIRFAGSGDTSVSFNHTTKTITISSTPGAGGGGAVTSFNGRDGAVVSEDGDYSTSQVTEGSNLYFTQARVRSTPLTGLVLTTSSAIIATDTLIQALGKLQAQMNSRALSSRTLTVSGTAGRLLVSGGAQNLTANREWVADLAPSGVTAGTYTKTTVDTYGRVTSGSSLAAADIPNLPASKITSGIFPISRIPTGTTSTTVALGNDSRFHTHSNKSILDGITQAKVNNWDTAFGWGDFRDWGLGKYVSIDENDLNNYNLTGFYRFNNTEVNRPFAFGTLYHAGRSTNEATQLAIPVQQSNSMMWRGSTSANYFAWRTLWDNNNLTKLSDLTNDLGNYGNWITQAQGDARYALRTISITGTGGLIGGGNLTANRTIDLSTTSKTQLAQGVTAYGWGDFRRFGLGSIGTGTLLGDLNTLGDTGAGLYSISTTSTGSPFSGSSGSILVLRSNVAGSSGTTQLALLGNNTAEPKAFIRMTHGTTADSTIWRELYHTGNFATGTTSQYIRGDGTLATYANTTYSAGSGLTLSGTTFSLPITTSGSGTYVRTVTQTANGLTVTLGTPPNTNTTYALVTQAAINAGTETTARLISAKLLKDNFQYLTTARVAGTTAAIFNDNKSSGIYAIGNTSPGGGALSYGVLQSFQSSNDRFYQMYHSTNGTGTTPDIFIRGGGGAATTWGAWRKLLHTGNFATGTTAQYIRGDGSLATYANTTYTAGSGLTLSGTAFSLPVTISGTGTYVRTVVQNTNGITVTLGTPPNTNTTYGNGSIALLDAGTDGTQRVWQANSITGHLTKTYVPQTRTLSNGTGITGGGNLTANRTISIAAAYSPNTRTLLTTQNLNDITTPGFYGQSSNANATTARNYPENYAGNLMVLSSAGVEQIYSVYNNSRRYRRDNYGGSWSAWVRIDVQFLTAGSNVSINASGVISATNTNTTYSNFTRTVAGLVPAPGASTTTRYLREDGTWVIPPNTNTTYSAGTLAQLNTGTVTTNYLWSPKNLADHLKGRYVALTGNQTVAGIKTFSSELRCTQDIVAYSSSDKRLKDNIKKIQNPLSLLSKVSGNSFTWNSLQSVYEGEDYGVIAQEVEEILPHAVVTRDNGYKAVKYEKLIPLLIEAVKELQNELNELRDGCTKN